jgi:hypothetical protein
MQLPSLIGYWIIGNGWSMTSVGKVIYAPCKQQYMDATNLGTATSTYYVPYPSAALFTLNDFHFKTAR